MIYLNIADVIFKINDENFILEYYSSYLHTIIGDRYDHEIILERTNYNNYNNIGEYFAKNYDYKVYKINDGYSIEFFQRHPVREQVFCACQLFVSYDWNTLKLLDYITTDERSKEPCEYIPSHVYKFKQLFICIDTYITGVLLYHQAFTLHSVALQYNNKGICFTASSGVGKTTHTNFWKEKFNAEILNGDSPIIRFVDDKPYIYGAPWCGTSRININKKMPLDVVVTLKRGVENKIKKLSKFEAVSFIFGQMRRPIWDEKLIDMCLTYAEMLANTVSVYELTCLPNEEAAEVALAGIEELHG